MSLLRSRCRLARPIRQLQTRNLSRTAKPPPFPTIESCPAATCSCAETPALPARLKIEHDKPLSGTMSTYAEQVLVCTGQDDWSSHIEEEHSGDNLAADVKELVGRGGIYNDPFHNISTINSSFPSTPPPPRQAEVQNSSAYLFPSFKYVPFLPRVSFGAVEALVQGYLLPSKLHAAHDGLSPIHRDRLTRKAEAASLLHGVTDVRDLTVLICGHGGRDARCGIFGPVLRKEFEEQLGRQDVEVLRGPVPVGEGGEGQALLGGEVGEEKKRARVGLISHIGGHKFAGNVIIYVPPTWRDGRGGKSTLAGMGIWYGRVEPRHVEGIVRETVLGGRVVKDLFRGGIRQGGEILML